VDRIFGQQHFTLPPPRYTEASLVKKLEEYGIGRPSTYATIISTLQDRGYAVLDKKRFVPSNIGRLVNGFLTSHFHHYVDYGFTANLEEELDEISNGSLDWIDVLREFRPPCAEGLGDALLGVSPQAMGLVQQLVDDSAIEAAAHGCSLQYQSTEPVTIAGDPELLRRAVENVLRNAIRYAPRDTTVEVKLSRKEAGAVVEIRDHGQGVPEEALPRIFDPFYRVESDRNRLSGGIGLGLSIARRAVELHKGAIRAANAHPGLQIDMEFPVA